MAAGMIVAYAVGNDESLSMPPRGNRLDLGLSGLEAGEDPIRVLDERSPRRGEPDRPRASFHERDACLPLERCDLLGYRGRREREGLGSRGDGAALGHLPEDPHAPNVEHKRSLTHDKGRSVAMMLVSWHRSRR
jgi:hypothetical protein